MKTKLLWLPIMALAMSACSSSNSPDKFNTNTEDINITDYDWHLLEGRNASQAFIPELKNTKILVTFKQNKMNFSGGCNNFMSGITLTKDSFITNAMASTRKACAAKLMKQDDLVNDFFNLETIQYNTNKQGGNVILTLKNTKSESLTLQGSPTAETLYGDDKKTTFIEISAQKSATCKNDLECYKYRFVTYDDGYAKSYGEWIAGLPEIKDYTKNPHIREIVRVKEFPTKGTGSIYVFDMRVEQEIIK